MDMLETEIVLTDYNKDDLFLCASPIDMSVAK
jgi:hypothetical protein